MSKLLAVAAVAFGLSVAYVDSRPNWDDTGITAVVVCAACGLCGALDPLRPWLWALCIGVWIPAYGITVTGNYGSLLALAIAFVSAYAGAGLRKILAPYATLTDRA